MLDDRLDQRSVFILFAVWPVSIFSTYQSEFGDLPGWFNSGSQAIWDCLLSYQTNTDVGGHLLEIGLFKGKSATLSALHARPKEKNILVDTYVRAEVREHFNKLKDRNCVLLQARSEYLNSVEFLANRGNRFRWIHIDGEHTGMAVKSDLELADRLLNHQGIVCLDDFMSSSYPQITRAAFRYLDAHPESLVLVLCGFNKGYFCRPIHAPELRAYIGNHLANDMSKRIDEPVTLWRTTVPDDLAAYGITKRWNDEAYRGPDWALKQRFD